MKLHYQYLASVFFDLAFAQGVPGPLISAQAPAASGGTGSGPTPVWITSTVIELPPTVETSTVTLGAPALITSTVTIFPSGPGAPSPSAVSSASASASAGSGGSGGGGTSSVGAVCGPGYTYCGYILKLQGFSDTDLFNAYCAGGQCPGGKPATDPLAALFICLPPTASPKKIRELPGGDSAGRLFFRLQDTGTITSTSTSTSSTSSSAGVPPPPPSSSGTCEPPNVTGNKLELLCACDPGDASIEDTCLNPAADHIGRCAKSCTN